MMQGKRLKLSLVRQSCRCYYSSAGRQSSPSYCVDLVRRHDYDHYLCSLLLPKTVRSAVFAIRAFNVEVAQVRDVVSERRVGQMRIQFWKDTIDAVYKGDPPKQPVAQALTDAVQRHKLSKMWFTRLLDARESDLSTSVYLSTRDMEDYAEHTSSALLYLTLETLDHVGGEKALFLLPPSLGMSLTTHFFGVREVTADHAASHVGKAEGIVTLLRAASYHRTKKSVLLPMDIVTRHGASQEDFLRGNVTQAVRDATFDLSSLAHTHLQKARSMKGKIHPPALKVLLPAEGLELRHFFRLFLVLDPHPIPCKPRVFLILHPVCLSSLNGRLIRPQPSLTCSHVVCESFLNRIQQAHFNPFDPSLTTRAPLLPFTLLWRSWKRTY